VDTRAAGARDAMSDVPRQLLTDGVRCCRWLPPWI